MFFVVFLSSSELIYDRMEQLLSTSFLIIPSMAVQACIAALIHVVEGYRWLHKEPVTILCSVTRITKFPQHAGETYSC
jgi:hypothetical protein